MRLSSSLVRPLALVLLVVSVAGCSWFKKGAKGDYALAPEARPLEVPPDLNVPNTSGAMQVPNVGPAASAGAATPAAGGTWGRNAPATSNAHSSRAISITRDTTGLTMFFLWTA